MAKVLFTAVVADMRNKLNGTVFSKNRYGAYTRTKVTPVNPQTTAQQTQRSNLAANSQAWRGLTEDQRQGWISAAPNFPVTDIYGNQKILSGQALFVRLNNNLQKYNSTPILDAPSPVAVPGVSDLVLTADASAQTLSLDFAPDPIPLQFVMVVFATPQITPGRNFVKNEFRFVVVDNPAATSPLALEGDYIPLFGALVAGQKVFVKAFLLSLVTGQAGVPSQVQTIVVP